MTFGRRFAGFVFSPLMDRSPLQNLTEGYGAQPSRGKFSK
jgi:hypothetical protein